jgi:hypothetical protein
MNAALNPLVELGSSDSRFNRGKTVHVTVAAAAMHDFKPRR